MVIHHGVVKGLLLVQSSVLVLVSGTLALLERRSLTHEQVILTRHFALREVTHLRIACIRSLLAAKDARVLLAGLATGTRSGGSTRAQTRSCRILIGEVQLLLVDHAQ